MSWFQKKEGKEIKENLKVYDVKQVVERDSWNMVQYRNCRLSEELLHSEVLFTSLPPSPRLSASGIITNDKAFDASGLSEHQELPIEPNRPSSPSSFVFIKPFKKTSKFDSVSLLSLEEKLNQGVNSLDEKMPEDSNPNIAFPVMLPVFSRW